ncbi:MAG: oxidoreductase [Myxococcaceae bacterium]
MNITKPKALTLRVRERIVETPDTTTLVFDSEQPLPPYQGGQFLTLDPKQFAALRPFGHYLEKAKGLRKEMARAYSMSSAPHEPLAITIKEDPFIPGETAWPPLLSPFLTHAAFPGLEVQAMGFSGPYILPPDIEQRTDHVLHVVAGSGVVPNFSIIKASLHAHPRLRHTLVWSNKRWVDVAFKHQLSRLLKAHPDRLRVVHTLTRETNPAPEPGVRAGRIDAALLASFVPDPNKAWVYVCGPAVTSYERKAALAENKTPAPRFLETMLDAFEKLGVPKTNVKREAYG